MALHLRHEQRQYNGGALLHSAILSIRKSIKENLLTKKIYSRLNGIIGFWIFIIPTDSILFMYAVLRSPPFYAIMCKTPYVESLRRRKKICQRSRNSFRVEPSDMHKHIILLVAVFLHTQNSWPIPFRERAYSRQVSGYRNRRWRSGDRVFKLFGFARAYSD